MVVVITVVVAVEVAVMLVVTRGQPHFQQLSYILSYAIALKLNLLKTPSTRPCSCDRLIGC